MLKTSSDRLHSSLLHGVVIKELSVFLLKKEPRYRLKGNCICNFQLSLPAGSHRIIQQTVRKVLKYQYLKAAGTLLHDAARGGSAEIIKILTEKGFSAGLKDRYGWTPLHYAALNNRTEAIEMF